MDLYHHIDIEADADAIYKALTTKDGLRGWWTADSEADEKVGGKAAFGFYHRKMVFRMDIIELKPGKRVVWECTGDHPEWAGTRLEWDIGGESLMEGTGLSFRHLNWKERSLFCASCNSSWGDLMWRLKAYVEGKNPGPKWTE